MYNPITKESLRATMKEIMQGMENNKKVLKLYVGDGNGNLIPVEQSPQFHESMKQSCAEMHKQFDLKNSKNDNTIPKLL
jgi:hypothetical protein